jgi:hypothetical protein
VVGDGFAPGILQRGVGLPESVVNVPAGERSLQSLQGRAQGLCAGLVDASQGRRERQPSVDEYQTRDEIRKPPDQRGGHEAAH